MAPKIIVSYDDTANDRDALALGRLLAGAGGELALAYVRHFPRSERTDELREQRAADALLARGGLAIGAPEIERHVVVHASTGEGLWELAEREGTDVVVFGSEYRTAQGTVRPGTSASRLLAGGPAAVAIAPAGFRSELAYDIERIGVITEGQDLAPSETALSVGFHTLRHTCASLLIERGLSVLRLQRWMGHHSPAFTLETYGHLIDGDLGPGLDLREELATGRI